MITMADWSQKPIEWVVPGEMVRTLTGIGRVTKTKRYRLGVGRSIIKLGDLYMSDDHSIWTMHQPHSLVGQWWGTYNYSHYLWEMNHVDENDGEGPQLERHSVPLVRFKKHKHATLNGWEELEAVYQEGYSPDTELCHLIVDTGSYICDGIVMSSSPKDIYYVGADWRGR